MECRKEDLLNRFKEILDWTVSIYIMIWFQALPMRDDAIFVPKYTFDFIDNALLCYYTADVLTQKNMRDFKYMYWASALKVQTTTP